MSTKHKGGADSLIRHKEFFMQDTFFDLEYRYSRRTLLGWPDEFFKIFSHFSEILSWPLRSIFWLWRANVGPPAGSLGRRGGREGTNTAASTTTAPATKASLILSSNRNLFRKCNFRSQLLFLCKISVGGWTGHNRRLPEVIELLLSFLPLHYNLRVNE